MTYEKNKAFPGWADGLQRDSFSGRAGCDNDISKVPPPHYQQCHFQKVNPMARQQGKMILTIQDSLQPMWKSWKNFLTTQWSRWVSCRLWMAEVLQRGTERRWLVLSGKVKSVGTTETNWNFSLETTWIQKRGLIPSKPSFNHRKLQSRILHRLEGKLELLMKLLICENSIQLSL